VSEPNYLKTKYPAAGSMCHKFSYSFKHLALLQDNASTRNVTVRNYNPLHHNYFVDIPGYDPIPVFR